MYATHPIVVFHYSAMQQNMQYGNTCLYSRLFTDYHCLVSHNL